MFESYTSYDDAIKNLHKFHLPVILSPLTLQEVKALLNRKS